MNDNLLNDVDTSVKPFCCSQPVNIVFGAGKIRTLQELAEKNGYKRGVLVCDKLFASNGVAEKIVSFTPSICATFSDVTPNPTLDEAKAAAQLFKEINADFVVALGGGSSIDLAKFASVFTFEDGDIRDFFYRKRKFSGKRLPLIAVPTTAGTGSEVTCVAVMNDDTNGVKSPLSDVNLFANTALVDPELTLSVPPFVTAVTGLDAMAHALEAYWCKAHNPLSDDFALGALKLIFGSLENAYNCGSDIAARESMSLGALSAGLAFASTRTAAVHACSYPLSTDFHLCHGEACAFTLDSFIKVNAAAEPKRMAALSTALGFETAEQMAEEVVRLKKVAELKTTLSEVGITDTAVLAKECLEHPLWNNNPVRLNENELKELFDSLK